LLLRKFYAFETRRGRASWSITPVVYLYLGRLQARLRGDRRDPARADQEIRPVAAE